MLKKNILSIIFASIILYLSLASSNTFSKVSFANIPNLDKIVHFCMYFGLMSAIIFENRQTLRNSKLLFLTSLIPLAYGILMELLQATITVSRSASFWDVVFNASGIIVSLSLWLLIKSFRKESVR